MAVPADATTPANQEAQPAYGPSEELRLAVVMYGGVSLAIYMYGVAEELLHLVRSTAESEKGSRVLRRPESTEHEYRELERRLDADTRFVVDIISGTSAGGINGICLAKALARDTGLDDLKKVWLEEGDIASLLNDEESGFRRTPDGALGEPIDGLAYSPPPASLLRGARMQRTLVDALRAMGEDTAGRSSSTLVDELDLWVTATDLEGLPVTIQLLNATAKERRHANRYRFHHPPRGGLDDFGTDDSTFVAYAARSTSAFPFAFDPSVLDAFESDREHGSDWAASKRDWERFHPDYASAVPRFAKRSFSDGGILDNKPFSYATETLVARKAKLPVSRKLIYIEPDPVSVEEDSGQARTSWNAIDTAVAATLRIPQVETIREDIQALLARNREIERVRDILSLVGTSPPESAWVRAITDSKPSDDWGAQTLSASMEGPTYGMYHRLKVRGVVDWISGLLASAAGLDPRSDDALAAHQVVRAWKSRHFAEEASAEPSSEEPSSENLFLIRFDVPYRIRRLDFVMQKLKELTGADREIASRAWTASGQQGDPPVGAVGAQGLNTLRQGLQAARDELTRGEDVLSNVDLPANMNGLGLYPSDLVRVLGSGDDDASDAATLQRAQELVSTNEHAFDSLAKTVAEVVGATALRARELVNGALEKPALDPRLRAALQFFYDRFEAFDLALYPLSFGTSSGETNPVGIMRISPRDAKGPRGGAHPALKGASLHHFGAFLDREWRRNDIVWGRLDAAECLIGTLFEGEPAERDRLVTQAHDRIVAEYAAEVALPPEQALERLYAPGDGLDRERTMVALTRGQRVVGKLLSAIVNERTGSTSPPSAAAAVAALEAVFGDGRRRPAMAALAALPKARLAIAVLVAVAALGLALAVLGPVEGLGFALLGGAVASAAVLVVALYWGLGALRKLVQETTAQALTKP